MSEPGSSENLKQNSKVKDSFLYYSKILAKWSMPVLGLAAFSIGCSPENPTPQQIANLPAPKPIVQKYSPTVSERLINNNIAATRTADRKKGEVVSLKPEGSLTEPLIDKLVNSTVVIVLEKDNSVQKYFTGTVISDTDNPDSDVSIILTNLHNDQDLERIALLNIGMNEKGLIATKVLGSHYNPRFHRTILLVGKESLPRDVSRNGIPVLETNSIPDHNIGYLTVPVEQITLAQNDKPTEVGASGYYVSKDEAKKGLKVSFNRQTGEIIFPDEFINGPGGSGGDIFVVTPEEKIFIVGALSDIGIETGNTIGYSSMGIQDDISQARKSRDKQVSQTSQ